MWEEEIVKCFVCMGCVRSKLWSKKIIFLSVCLPQKRVKITPVTVTTKVPTQTHLQSQAQAARKKLKSAPVMMYNPSKAGTGTPAVRIIGQVGGIQQKIMYTTGTVGTPGQTSGIRPSTTQAFSPFIPGVRNVVVDGQKNQAVSALQGAAQRQQLNVQQTPPVRATVAGAQKVTIGAATTSTAGSTTGLPTQLTGNHKMGVFLIIHGRHF